MGVGPRHDGSHRGDLVHVSALNQYLYCPRRCWYYEFYPPEDASAAHTRGQHEHGQYRRTSDQVREQYFVAPDLGLHGQVDVINYFTTTGGFRGRFVPADGSLALLHRHQHTISDETRREVAREIVAGKVRNARRYLRRHDASAEVVSVLDGVLAELGSATTLDAVRGLEGRAARRYFDGYDSCLPDGWVMEGRSRRPPEDRVNSLLSLTYTFVQRRCEAALRSVNLDPYVGVFHSERHGRPALTLDLLEEFRRSIADPFVLKLLSQQIVSHDDFTSDHELADDAFDTYLGAFDDYVETRVNHPLLTKKPTRREVIHLQARLLRKRIVGEINQYEAYEIPS